jgi:cell surface protein SprA
VVVLDPSTGILIILSISCRQLNNDYDPDQIKVGTGLLNNNIREIATSNSGFNTTVTEGQDYSKLENARKLTLNEYSYNAQLGYISYNNV